MMKLDRTQRAFLRNLLARHREPQRAIRLSRIFFPVSTIAIALAVAITALNVLLGAAFVFGFLLALVVSYFTSVKATVRKWSVLEEICDWDRAKALLRAQESESAIM
jgi:hypothetical protein